MEVSSFKSYKAQTLLSLVQEIASVYISESWKSLPEAE